MEEQQRLQELQPDPNFRRTGITIGVAFLVFAAQTVWKHGWKDWDWVLDAALAIMGSSIAVIGWEDKRESFEWPSGTLNLISGLLFSAWVAHSLGLVPGLCLVGVFVLPAVARKGGPWSLSRQAPLGIICWVLIIVGVGWFVRGSNAWIPLSCVAAIAILLAYQPPGRRSMKQNLLRPASVSWIALAAIALVWFSKEPSFGGGLLLFAIPALWFGNLLIHLSPGERPLALSHPQS
jgi:hypothetical protein